VQKIWPEVTGFSHVKWILNPSGYRAFLRLTLSGATIAESIVHAVRSIIGTDKKKVFTRDEVREAAGIDRTWWKNSWSPIFQGMRADQAGGAPIQAEKHQRLFRAVSRGRFVLTARGWSLIRPSRDDELKRIGESLDEKKYFDAKDERDEREKRNTEIAQRRGQPAFRRKLLNAYEHACAITDCDAEEALEAAHITRFLGEKSNHVTNGILLRSDIHTLFDLDLLGIHPKKLTVTLARSLRGSHYKRLAGKQIFVPEESKRPDVGALKKRWLDFKKASSI
jgi:hypothetical protein